MKIIREIIDLIYYSVFERTEKWHVFDEQTDLPLERILSVGRSYMASWKNVICSMSKKSFLEIIKRSVLEKCYLFV